MSDASPVNNTPQTQSQAVAPVPAAGSGNVKAIAMLVIGLGVGMIAGAFLAPIAENFFGPGGGIQPQPATGVTKDERSGPAAIAPAKAAAPTDDASEKPGDAAKPVDAGKAAAAVPSVPPKP